MQISYQNKLKENKVRGETEKEICDITILKVQTGGQFRGEKKQQRGSYISYSGIFYINENNVTNYLLDYLMYFLDFPPKMIELERERGGKKTQKLVLMLPRDRISTKFRVTFRLFL